MFAGVLAKQAVSCRAVMTQQKTQSCPWVTPAALKAVKAEMEEHEQVNTATERNSDESGLRTYTERSEEQDLSKRECEIRWLRQLQKDQ